VASTGNLGANSLRYARAVLCHVSATSSPVLAAPHGHSDPFQVIKGAFPAKRLCFSGCTDHPSRPSAVIYCFLLRQASQVIPADLH
jgi:hypothetical protein